MANIKQYITENEDGFELNIALDEEFAGVKVTGVSMFVGKDAEDGEGDLAVLWETTGLENTGGGDMGSLIMRGDDDEVGGVMGEFYWEGGYTDRLREILLGAGFSKDSVEDVDTSEWGMQDEGRVSYDAYTIAEEVREAMLETA